MVVGIVDHQHGTRDVRRLPRPGRRVAATCSSSPSSPPASMAGVPLLFGFVAKEADFDVFVDQGAGAHGRARRRSSPGRCSPSPTASASLAGVAGRLAPPGTAAPAADHGPPRLAFVAPGRRARRGQRPLRRRARSRRRARRRRGAARSTGPTTEAHLALWHGVNLELLLSARRPRRRRRAVRRPARASTACSPSAPRVPSAAGAYRGALRGLNAVADRVTAVAQPGSLPVYLGVILLTAAVVPGALLLGGTWWPGWPDARRRPGPRARSPPC